MHGGVMQAKLDGLPPLALQAQRHLGAFGRGGEQHQAGIGQDLVLGAAPQFVERLTTGFANEVPEGNIDASSAAIGQAVDIIAQRRGMLLHVKGVFPYEVGLDRRQELRINWRANADQPRSGVDLDIRSTANLKRQRAPWAPGGFEFSHMAHRFERYERDIADRQARL